MSEMTSLGASASAGVAPRALSQYKQKRAVGETREQFEARRLAHLMVFGLDEPDPRFPEIEAGVPSLSNAAKLLGIRWPTARLISDSAGYQRVHAEMMVALRNGAKPKALHRIIGLVDERGDGKAADRKVQLEAAKTVLGEDAKGVSVNVNVNTQVNTDFRPGYVILLRADAPTPSTIEARAERPLHPSFAADRRMEAERAAEDEREAEAERDRRDPIFRKPPGCW